MTGSVLAGRDALKRAAALAAVAEVEDGMIVGIGTGTTASFAIAALAQRAIAGLRVSTVATSIASARLATSLGLRVIAFDDLHAVDIGIDGVDEIDGRLHAIKGAGGALLREKIVAAAAGQMIIIADEAKQVAQIGARALPVEVLPFAGGFVARRVADLGARVVLRLAGSEWYQTDQQNHILDCHFGPIDQPERLAAQLACIPGLLGHGLFLTEIDRAYIAMPAGVRCVKSAA